MPELNDKNNVVSLGLKPLCYSMLVALHDGVLLVIHVCKGVALPKIGFNFLRVCCPKYCHASNRCKLNSQCPTICIAKVICTCTSAGVPTITIG